MLQMTQKNTTQRQPETAERNMACEPGRFLSQHTAAYTRSTAGDRRCELPSDALGGFSPQRRDDHRICTHDPGYLQATGDININL